MGSRTGPARGASGCSSNQAGRAAVRASLSAGGEGAGRTYLFELICLQLPLSPILIVLQRGQQEENLGDDDLGEAVIRSSRTAGAGARGSTQDATLRRVGRMAETSRLDRLA